MFTNKYLSVVVTATFFLFSACSSGGGSSGDQKTKVSQVGILSSTYSINTTDENNITVDGKNGDKLVISIPKNPFVGFDGNVTFSLEYTDGNPLPRIVISEDINFTYQVTLEFTSDYLSEHNLSLYMKA